jgi:hypothetical protein
MYFQLISACAKHCWRKQVLFLKLQLFLQYCLRITAMLVSGTVVQHYDEVINAEKWADGI